jgi:hypothetical protein
MSLIAVAAQAGAATVGNTNDAGPGSLRQAIADAAPGETITVPAGGYTLSSAELLIAKSLTLAGAGAASTTIQAAGTFRVIKVTGSGTDVTISGVKIRNGHQEGNPALGGGVLDEGAKLTLKEARVVENVASSPGANGFARGGGVAVTGGGALTLVEADLSGNTATAAAASGEPGGIANGGGVASFDSTLSVLGSTFIDNIVDARGGQGAPDAKQGGGLAAGGGIWALGGSATVTASTIAANVSDSTQGPGASVSGINEGAGIALRTQVPGTIVASTIDGNILRGGSIAHGGGIFVNTGVVGTRLLSDTITDNAIESAGASASGGNLSTPAGTLVADTIISGGTAPGATGNCDGSVESQGFNLESADQCGFHGPGDLVSKDPQLGALQSAGGPTPTRPPSRTSPAVDAGSAFGRVADQRVLARPIDFLATPNSAAPGADGSDIGAVELQPPRQLRLGKLTRRPSGIALLKVRIPDPVAGSLKVSGAGLKALSKGVRGETTTLKIQTSGKARKALRLRGRRRVRIRVTYVPVTAALVSTLRKALLTQRHKAHRLRH